MKVWVVQYYDNVGGVFGSREAADAFCLENPNWWIQERDVLSEAPEKESFYTAFWSKRWPDADQKKIRSHAAERFPWDGYYADGVTNDLGTITGNAKTEGEAIRLVADEMKRVMASQGPSQ